MENEQADAGRPVSRHQILRHVRGQGIFIFPVQLTTSRIGNLNRLIHTLLYVMPIHTYILLTQSYCHRETRLNVIKRFCICSLMLTEVPIVAWLDGINIVYYYDLFNYVLYCLLFLLRLVAWYGD